MAIVVVIDDDNDDDWYSYSHHWTMSMLIILPIFEQLASDVTVSKISSVVYVHCFRLLLYTGTATRCDRGKNVVK